VGVFFSSTQPKEELPLGFPENERKQHFHRNGTKRSSETKFTEKEQFDFFLSKIFKNNS